MRAACLLLFLWWCSVSSAAVSPLCLTHAALSVAEARRGATWALHMLDASTKVPDGLLYGNTMQLGHFDQCLAVDVHPETLPAFQGRYCRTWVDLNLPLDEATHNSSTKATSFKVLYAVCLPSSCSPEDVAPLLQDHVAPLLGLDVNVSQVNPNYCFVKASEPLTAAQISGVTLFSLLTSLVLICTCLEAWRGPESPPLLRAISARTTVRQLFSTRREPGALSCLHGLRVGSILWVILGHRYGQENTGPVSNTMEFFEMVLPVSAMTIGNAILSVDTFFLLSGLLMCMSFMRETQRGATFDVLKFYLYRYLRLGVPMLIVIVFYATVFPLLGSGPLWHRFVTSEAEACRLNWWTNMAYINTYYYKGIKMCLGQTWYTAVDMQLAWLSPLVLLPLKFSPRAGLQLTSLLILISCAIPFTLTYLYKYSMSMDLSGRPMGADFGIHIYNSTPTRSVSYLCGILLGFFLVQAGKQRQKIPKMAVVLGWTLSTLVCLTVVYSVTVMYQPGYVYDDLAAAFYAGLHRLAWCAGLSWIIVACVNGYGGPVDKLLSWRPLTALSRLTYGAYLLHFVIIFYDRGTSRTSNYFSHFQSVHAFLGDLVPVFSLALLLYVLVEGPLLATLRIAFRGGGRKIAESKHDLVRNKEEREPQNIQ